MATTSITVGDTPIGLTTVVLGSDHSITSSNVLESTALAFTGVSGKRYIFNAYLKFTNNVTGGVKVNVRNTDGGSPTWYVQWVQQAGTNFSSGTRVQHFTTAATDWPTIQVGGSHQDCIHSWESIVTVGTGGTFTIQFAQNVSNPGATVMKAGSFIQYQQVD